MLKSMQLKFERDKLKARLGEIQSRAEAEGRDLLADEQREWDRGLARLRELDEAIARAEQFEDAERASAVPIEVSGFGAVGLPSGGLRDDPEILGPADSVRSWAERRGLVTADEPRFGTWLQAVLGVGDRTKVGAVLRESVGEEGGFLTPVGVSSEIIDLARAKAVMTQAGALVRPITTKEQTYPRLASDAQWSWVAEGATIPESTVSFEAIVHYPHKLATLIKITPELIEDADGVEQFVRDALAAGSALVIDAAGLRGDGVQKPAGIRDWSGITLISDAGGNGFTPTDYSQLVDAITAIRAANFEPGAMIAAPRTYGTYGKLTDTTGQPLRAPDDVARLRKLSTTSIPTNLTEGTSNDTSETYLGEFSNYVFSVRVRFELQVLRERFADEGKVGLLARLRVDGSPIRDAAFAVITGIRP